MSPTLEKSDIWTQKHREPGEPSNILIPQPTIHKNGQTSRHRQLKQAETERDSQRIQNGPALTDSFYSFFQLEVTEKHR